jgi:hypothetical protein
MDEAEVIWSDKSADNTIKTYGNDFSSFGHA